MVHVLEDYERFREAGADVAVITMGTPEQVAEFRTRMRLPFRCLADPDRIAYQAFGVPCGTLRQIAGPVVWLRSAASLLRHGGGRPVGDPMQLHGSFVVNQEGIVQFAHAPQNSADLPSHQEIISVLQQLSCRDG